MFKNRLCNDFLLLTAAGLIFACALAFHQISPFPTFSIDKQDSAHNINRDFLKLISMGNKRLFGSTIWIKTLLESDETHYSKRDMNSWMYHRFRSISELDPFFYENYLWGGMFLSIVKDDLEGAADIYELGIKNYPNDYRLLYNAGFNYYFEMGDFSNGNRLFQLLMSHPQTSDSIKFIINKLQFENTKDYEAAISFIKFKLSQTKDEVLQRKLYNDLYSLTSDRDLNCLNSNKKDCNKKDLEGNDYILKNGQWQAAREYKPYKIFRRKDV